MPVLQLVVNNESTKEPRVDAREFAEITSEHSAALLRYVSRLTMYDRHLAEDIVQETLLRLWQRPQTWQRDSDRTVLPWLYTVARNLVIDHRRARRIRPQETDDSDLANRPMVDMAMNNVLDSTSIAVALGMISDDHRAVVEQIYYRGQTLAGAGEALGVPIGTVKSRLHYAQRALKEIVTGLGLAPERSGPLDDELPAAA
ncbi:MAG TPA: sigma-70 family RNA polymerase sigma factor [Pseudonocardiaceae bacterium]|jgi:RNA polymerase sigma-70 factor (ECF subfamily)